MPKLTFEQRDQIAREMMLKRWAGVTLEERKIRSAAMNAAKAAKKRERLAQAATESAR